MKGLRTSKNEKKKFEGVWGQLEQKKVSRDNNSQNVESNCSLHVK